MSSSAEPDHDELALDLNDLALLYHGRIVHSLDSSSSGNLEILEDHLLGVTSSGLISFLVPSSSALLERCLAKDGFEYIHPESRHAFLLPGFTDTHLHAPQYLFAGTALDVPLMEWLNKCVHELDQRKGYDAERITLQIYIPFRVEDRPGSTWIGQESL